MPGVESMVNVEAIEMEHREYARGQRLSSGVCIDRCKACEDASIGFEGDSLTT